MADPRSIIAAALADSLPPTVFGDWSEAIVDAVLAALATHGIVLAGDDSVVDGLLNAEGEFRERAERAEADLAVAVARLQNRDAVLTAFDEMGAERTLAVAVEALRHIEQQAREALARIKEAPPPGLTRPERI